MFGLSGWALIDRLSRSRFQDYVPYLLSCSMCVRVGSLSLSRLRRSEKLTCHRSTYSTVGAYQVFELSGMVLIESGRLIE